MRIPAIVNAEIEHRDPARSYRFSGPARNPTDLASPERCGTPGGSPSGRHHRQLSALVGETAGRHLGALVYFGRLHTRSTAPPAPASPLRADAVQFGTRGPRHDTRGSGPTPAVTGRALTGKVRHSPPTMSMGHGVGSRQGQAAYAASPARPLRWRACPSGLASRARPMSSPTSGSPLRREVYRSDDRPPLHNRATPTRVGPSVF